MPVTFFDDVGPQAIGSRLRQVSERFTEEARRVYRLFEVDLEPKWFPVFRTLAAEEDGLSTSEVARRIGHTHASVSQITAEMAAAGVITAQRSREDGRVNVIRLSNEGRQLVPGLDEQCGDVSAAVEKLLAECSHDLWSALREIETRLEERGLYDRIKDRRREREASDVSIVDLRPEHAAAFKTLNLAWIEQHFDVEASDREQLDDPLEQIIGPGGVVLMAEYRDEIVGTCALIKMDADSYELAKMAVSERARGKGLGLLLGQAALERARHLGARWVYLESNTVLEPAIALYRKLGFRQVFRGDSPYARCNIQMEVDLGVTD